VATNRPLILVIVICALSFTAQSAVAKPKPKHAEDQALITHFSWDASQDFTGTFASTLRFDWEGGENDCTLATAMSFAHSAPATEPMLQWLEWRTGGSEEWHGHTLAAGSLAEVHVGDALDTQSLVTEQGGSIAALYTSEGPFHDFLDMTLAGFNIEMDSRHPLDAPVTIDLTCATPFKVSSIAAGREGRSFTSQSLTGGEGASLALPASVVVNNGDGLQHTFANSTVIFSALGSIDLGTSVGRLTLEYPGGTQSWSPPSNSDSFLSAGLTGGSGTYDVALDLVSISVQSNLAGVLLGVNPVQSLDDVY
jgi:hypothetical protein